MSKNQNKTLQELRQVIEKIFQSVPLKLLYLRNQTYGWMNLFAAWGSLESDMNYREAMDYRHQAVLHYPQIRYTPIYLRLSLAIAVTCLFGPNSYANLRELTRTIRRQLRLATGI